MEEKEKRVYAFLDNLGIPYTRYEHPPVYTVEEAEKHWRDIPGVHCKNLFLRNHKGDRHFLVVLEKSKKVDLKGLAEKLGAGRLSFASAERLAKYLGLEAGAVSACGLINDTNREVRVVLDKDLSRAAHISMHPNVNTATITMSYAAFCKFLEECGNEIVYI